MLFLMDDLLGSLVENAMEGARADARKLVRRFLHCPRLDNKREDDS